MAKKNTITVNNKPIAVIQGADKQNYICLTDLIKAYEPDPVRTEIIIQNWLRQKDTIEFVGTWELLNNPCFNHIEFDVIRKSSGTNRFVLTAKEWNSRTNATGLIAKAGRYGGTYAHKDIAYHFGMWMSPVFYLLVVKEIQRLESAVNDPLLLQWDIKRLLAKTNYVVHTDAIKNTILPQLTVEKKKEYVVYASEADLLNLVVFGCTAKDWQESNPEIAGKMNVRDTASINELLVLSNLESYNAELISQGASREQRYSKLMEMRNKQLLVMEKANAEFNFKKLEGKKPKQMIE